MQKIIPDSGTICYKLPNVKYNLQFGSLCKVSLTLSTKNYEHNTD